VCSSDLTEKAPNFERGNAVYADGVLYIMEGNTGKLYCAQPDKTAYKQLGEAQVLAGNEIWAPMALADGKLFCRDQKQLKCVELKKAE
jgi:outer membrane protein assembly factor BamB